MENLKILKKRGRPRKKFSNMPVKAFHIPGFPWKPASGRKKVKANQLVASTVGNIEALYILETENEDLVYSVTEKWNQAGKIDLQCKLRYQEDENGASDIDKHETADKLHQLYSDRARMLSQKSRLKWQLEGDRNTSGDIIYLSANISASVTSIQFWDPLVDKMKKKLATWKTHATNSAGRLVLLKAALDSIPVFWLSLFKLPKLVVNKLDIIRKDFFWGHYSNNGSVKRAKWEVKDGQISYFWEDYWIGDKPLMHVFPGLCNILERQHSSVKHFLSLWHFTIYHSVQGWSRQFWAWEEDFVS
ncbi:hypothetical protein AgCh_012495 [Apium graveolens]